MTKKEVYKKLEWLAKELPEDEYEVWNGYGKDAVMTKHPVDHVRRLRKIWNRTHSFDDLNQYFKQYGRELKKDGQSIIHS